MHCQGGLKNQSGISRSAFSVKVVSRLGKFVNFALTTPIIVIFRVTCVACTDIFIYIYLLNIDLVKLHFRSFEFMNTKFFLPRVVPG